MLQIHLKFFKKNNLTKKIINKITIFFYESFFQYKKINDVLLDNKNIKKNYLIILIFKHLLVNTYLIINTYIVI